MIWAYGLKIFSNNSVEDGGKELSLVEELEGVKMGHTLRVINNTNSSGE